MAFATLSVDFVAKIASFEESMNRAGKSVASLENRFVAMGRTVSGALAGLGVGLGVGGIAAMVKSAIDAQDELSKLSQKTGIAVESLAGLQHAADLSGVEVDQLAKGVRTFSVLVDEAANGQKSYQDKLVSLGLNYKQLKDLSPEEQFYALADAVSKLGAQDRATAVAGALGDRLSALVPLLSGGADGLRDLVAEGQRLNPVTTESARRAEEFNDNLSRLQKEAGQAGIDLTMHLLPSLADTAQAMADLAREGHGMLALLRGFAGIGKIPFDIIIGDIEPARTAQQRIQELREELGALERKSKSGNGKLLQAIFGTPEEIQQQMTVIRNQIAALEKFGDKIYAPKGAAPASGAESDAAKQLCESIGGVWDGKKCRPKSASASGSKTDPLAGIIKQTDTARAQEYEKLLGLLDARFQSGRRNAQQYQEAVAVLNKQFGREAIDPLGSGSFSTTSKDVADFIREQQDAINGLNGEMAQDGVRAAQEYQSALEALLSDTTLAKTTKLQDSIDLLDKAFFDGAIGAGQYEEAIAKLTSGAAQKLEKTNDIAHELGLTFTSAFEDAVVGGEKFSDVLKGLERDIARIITRKTVTEPFGNAVSSAISGGFSNGFGNGQNLFGDIASLFGFATGGSFTVGGSGGTDSQLVAFRATPGEMVDVRTPGQAGGGGVTVIQHISVDSRSDQASILAAMAQARDSAVAAVQSSLRRGGSMAQLTAAA